jgi:integrase/recombinase XerD
MNDVFFGIYAPYLEQYLAYKRQLGFNQATERRMFSVFDRFTIERKEYKIGITPELSQAWIEAGVGLSSSYNYHRAVLINQLASFLNQQGIHSYIMRLPLEKRDFTPYIFSQDELQKLFDAIDNFRVTKGLRHIMFAMPALIRLLYATGLRGGEALALCTADVNLEDQFIIVHDSKNGQERIIPFSDSLAIVLKQYANYRSQLPSQINKDSNFFIAASGKRISHSSFGKWFNRMLTAAKISKTHGVSAHALRHTFSVHSLAMMAEEGIDIYCTLPILSTYLGHKSIESTNHYVRLVSFMYPGLLKDIDKVCLNVFPKIDVL